MDKLLPMVIQASPFIIAMPSVQLLAVAYLVCFHALHTSNARLSSAKHLLFLYPPLSRQQHKTSSYSHSRPTNTSINHVWNLPTTLATSGTAKKHHNSTTSVAGAACATFYP